MSEIRKWLEAIGLAQYADAFDANEIGMELLRRVDDQMLKDIGVSIGGHRLRIRDAIAKLAPAPIAEVNLSSTTPMHEIRGEGFRALEGQRNGGSRLYPGVDRQAFGCGAKDRRRNPCMAIDRSDTAYAHVALASGCCLCGSAPIR
jgi:hypothetical protein